MVKASLFYYFNIFSWGLSLLSLQPYCFLYFKYFCIFLFWDLLSQSFLKVLYLFYFPHFLKKFCVCDEGAPQDEIGVSRSSLSWECEQHRMLGSCWERFFQRGGEAREPWGDFSAWEGCLRAAVPYRNPTLGPQGCCVRAGIAIKDPSMYRQGLRSCTDPKIHLPPPGLAWELGQDWNSAQEWKVLVLKAGGVWPKPDFIQVLWKGAQAPQMCFYQ